MGMHLGVVSIEGDHLTELPDIFRKFGYAIEEVTSLNTSDAAMAAAEERPARNRVTKVAYAEDGFTHLLDLEMVLPDDDIWLEFTRKWSSRTIGWICEGASSTYSLAVCDQGRWIRQVVAMEGEVRVNKGNPLEEEEWIEWSEADETDVLAIVDRLGAGSDFSIDRKYTIYRLDGTGAGA